MEDENRDDDEEFDSDFGTNVSPVAPDVDMNSPVRYVVKLTILLS